MESKPEKRYQKASRVKEDVESITVIKEKDDKVNVTINQNIEPNPKVKKQKRTSLFTVISFLIILLCIPIYFFIDSSVFAWANTVHYGPLGLYTFPVVISCIFAILGIIHVLINPVKIKGILLSMLCILITLFLLSYLSKNSKKRSYGLKARRYNNENRR